VQKLTELRCKESPTGKPAFLAHPCSLIGKIPEICTVNTVTMYTLLFLGTLNNKLQITKPQDKERATNFISQSSEESCLLSEIIC
jgi:hypothetical protein